MSDLVGNPKARFSRVAAHLSLVKEAKLLCMPLDHPSFFSLRKHAHEINKDFLALRGGSNEYPQSMFWSKNKKNRYTPAYPQIYYIKVGFKGVYTTRTCFHDAMESENRFDLQKLSPLQL